MRKFLSILLCIIIFMCTFILQLILNFSNIFNENSIKNMSKSLISIENIKPEDITPENIYLKTSLDVIYDIAENYNISKEEVNNFLESDDAKNFIANYINEMLSSIMKNNYGDVSKSDTEKYLKNDIKKYLENNTNISNEDKENIKSFIDNNLSEILNKLPNITHITNNINFKAIKFLQKLFSLGTKIISSIIILISIIAIILLQLKKNKWLIYLGCTLLISCIFNLLFPYIIKLLLAYFINNSSNILLSMIKIFYVSILKSYLIINIIGIIVSISMLFIYNVIKRKKFNL